MDSQVFELAAGDVLVAKPVVVHHAENIGDVPAEMVVVYSSGRRDLRLAEET